SKKAMREGVRVVEADFRARGDDQRHGCGAATTDSHFCFLDLRLLLSPYERDAHFLRDVREQLAILSLHRGRRLSKRIRASIRISELIPHGIEQLHVTAQTPLDGNSRSHDRRRTNG